MWKGYHGVPLSKMVYTCKRVRGWALPLRGKHQPLLQSFLEGFRQSIYSWTLIYLHLILLLSWGDLQGMLFYFLTLSMIYKEYMIVVISYRLFPPSNQVSTNNERKLRLGCNIISHTEPGICLVIKQLTCGIIPFWPASCFPIMVYDFPEPVWPYAKIQML